MHNDDGKFLILGNGVVLFQAIKSIFHRLKLEDTYPDRQFFRKVPSEDDFLVINLSAAGLMRMTLWTPFSVVCEVTESWFFGQAMCKAGHFFRNARLDHNQID